MVIWRLCKDLRWIQRPVDRPPGGYTDSIILNIQNMSTNEIELTFSKLNLGAKGEIKLRFFSFIVQISF